MIEKVRCKKTVFLSKGCLLGGILLRIILRKLFMKGYFAFINGWLSTIKGKVVRKTGNKLTPIIKHDILSRLPF